MPEATVEPTTPARKARRRHVSAAPLGNVITLPKRPTGTDAIVAAVTARRLQEEQSLLERMRAVGAALNVRHRERANALIPIGVQMDRSTLDDFIEVGQRMLAARGARR